MPAVGERFGPYELCEFLGRGSMGDVYRARSPDGEQVALKLLTPPRAAQAETARRFHREIRMLGELDHPGLVRIRDAGDHDGTPFLAMELVRGKTLAHRLASGKLAATEAARIGAQLADALAYLHERGVLHRDLSAGNILGAGATSPLAESAVQSALTTAGDRTLFWRNWGTAAAELHDERGTRIVSRAFLDLGRDPGLQSVLDLPRALRFSRMGRHDEALEALAAGQRASGGLIAAAKARGNPFAASWAAEVLIRPILTGARPAAVQARLVAAALPSPGLDEDVQTLWTAASTGQLEHVAAWATLRTDRCGEDLLGPLVLTWLDRAHPPAERARWRAFLDAYLRYRRRDTWLLRELVK